MMRRCLVIFTKVIYENSIERMARTEFDRLKNEFPYEHFELLKLTITQEALDWPGRIKENGI